MLCRLYVNQSLCLGETIDLPANQAHYLRSVMRLTVADAIVLFNGNGGEYQAVIEQVERNQVRCLLESFVDVNREMSNRVHIIQAACRSEKIETVLQKGTELGAASFTIVRSERSTLKLDGAKLKKRLQRWQNIVMEAVEQSGRTIVPEVRWANTIHAVPLQGLCFALHPEPMASSWSQERAAIQQADDITLAVGPEGGWSERDIASLHDHGFHCLTFGSRVMRTETAAPALLAAIQAVAE